MVGQNNFPEDAKILEFSGFDGLNTKPSRPALEEQQMWVCDGFIPLGKSNLRTLYGIGTAIYTASGGNTITFFDFANIGNAPICMIFLSDGSIYQVNTETSASTKVADSGTITNPTDAIAMAQWGSQYVLIVAPQPNGYFVWDGTLFYQAGTVGPQVSIQSDGFGLTSLPTITIEGGSGTGASVSGVVADGALETLSVVAPGSGYSVTDSLYLAFSGGGVAFSTAVAEAVLSAGTVASVSIANAGYGYTTTSTVQFLGGGGLGALGTVVASAKTVSSVSISNPGQGYSVAPSVYITDNNNPVAQATLVLMPFGVSGTGIETFQDRVWIVNGAC